jgi:hypothetical protein
MSVRTPFDDQRHRKSEELTFFAERAARAGDLERARALYSDAAALEIDVAQAQTDEAPRSIFAVAGITCYLRAQKWGEVARWAHRFLSEPELLAPDARGEIESLLDDALRTQDLLAAMGSHGDAAPLELRLEGGRVHRGVAPSALVQQYGEIIEALLFRVADFKTNRKFRKAGRSVFAGKFVLYEAPARAASYGLRLFVASQGSASLAGPDRLSPGEAVGALLELAGAVVTEGTERLKDLVPDLSYVAAFTRAFRDLAPDGAGVASVTLGSPGALRRPDSVRFSPDHRVSLSRALNADGGFAQFSKTGTLKLVSLRSPRRIVVEQDDGGFHEYRLRGGEQDDTIGPKLNRRVRISATRRQSKDGMMVSWVDDLVLLDEAELAGEGP